MKEGCTWNVFHAVKVMHFFMFCRVCMFFMLYRVCREFCMLWRGAHGISVLQAYR